jgi:endo-1,4-beta-xylanase
MVKTFSRSAFSFLIATHAAIAQKAPLPALPPALGTPKPGPVTDAPYSPQPILQGGIVVPLYAPGSPLLKADRAREAEVYSMSQVVAGRINNIVNVHNPSIQLHLVDRGLNTGAVVILVPGGGHRALVIGSEGADFVPFFCNFGVNTAILRYRLRQDGYVAEVDAVHDAQQAIRMVRAYANDWNIDPNKIGIMGFSAGAELSSASAMSFDDFDRKNNDPSDPFSGISARPDFVGIIYPGPTPFATTNQKPPPIPRNVPPAFIATGGSGDRVTALWALEYAHAMIDMRVPNVEMHVYGNGRHPGDSLPDGSRMSGGLTDRRNIPYGSWQFRFIDWFRDLGFLQKPGVETKAAKDVMAFVKQSK